jgi:hypothetical protein
MREMIARANSVTLLRVPMLRSWGPLVASVSAYALLSAIIGPIVGWRGWIIDGPIFAAWACMGLSFTIAAAVASSLTRGWRVGIARAIEVAGRMALLVVVANVAGSLLTSWRVSIPYVHPYAWGPVLHRWDLTLHGAEPWRLAHALLHAPSVVRWLPGFVDQAYSIGWLAANVLVVLVLGLHPLGARGHRVLVAYVLAYAVLGSLAATVFSSAGPVYYGRVVAGPDPYAGLVPSMVAHLPAFAASAVQLQDYLWRAYVRGQTTLTSGITAFPSMHVATTTLLALALGSWRRWAGVVGWVFVPLTLLGSVYLGWHYAVDGYASIVGMVALWWLAGRMVRA